MKKPRPGATCPTSDPIELINPNLINLTLSERDVPYFFVELVLWEQYYQAISSIRLGSDEWSYGESEAKLQSTLQNVS